MLKTKQIASRYIELLGNRGDSVMGFTAVRIQEVKNLLTLSLAPLHKKALALLTDSGPLGFTSRELANTLGIGISRASNILSDLADYGLTVRILPEQKRLRKNYVTGRWVQYSGYVWGVRG